MMPNLDLPALEQMEESSRLIGKAIAIMYQTIMDQGDINSEHTLQLTLAWIAATFGGDKDSDT